MAWWYSLAQGTFEVTIHLLAGDSSIFQHSEVIQYDSKSTPVEPTLKVSAAADANGKAPRPYRVLPPTLFSHGPHSVPLEILFGGDRPGHYLGLPALSGEIISHSLRRRNRLKSLRA